MGESMSRYRKRPVVVEANQWFKNGDHPCDYADDREGFEDGTLRMWSGAEAKALEWQGGVVRYFRRPGIRDEATCVSSMPCKATMHDHGWIDTPEGGHTVCPGDWIITGVRGERYPCKPDIFAATYEPVEP